MACHAYERRLRYFQWQHLPKPLQHISAPFGVLAHQMINTLPDEHEEVVKALDRLLEAKDCAVRAALDLPEES